MTSSGERLEGHDGESTAEGPSDSNALGPFAGSQARVQFPPLHPGISTPRGAYLNAASASQDGGRPYIARCGFANLATSSHFVGNVRKDFETLLRAFEEQANDDVAEEEHREGSFFQVFASLFRAQGWHRSQLFWSEHEATRQAIFATVTRIFAEPLEQISKALEVDSDDVKLSSAQAQQLSRKDVVRACGSLFGLHLLRSTTVLTSKQRLRPGQGIRIALEADLHQALLAMPECMAIHFGGATTTDESDLQLVDDVTFVLDQLVQSDICVLAPTSLAVQSPVVSNRYTSKETNDRRRGLWAHLVELRDGVVKNEEYALSRTESGYAMVRQKLRLPHRRPQSDSIQARHSLGSSASAEAASSSSTSTAGVDARLRLDKVDTRAKWAGPARGLLAPPASTHSDDVKSVTASVQEKQQRLEAQKDFLLGRQSIAGDGFATNIRNSLSAGSSVVDREQKRPTSQATKELVKRQRLSAKDIVDHARIQTQRQIAHHFQSSPPKSRSS